MQATSAVHATELSKAGHGSHTVCDIFGGAMRPYLLNGMTQQTVIPLLPFPVLWMMLHALRAFLRLPVLVQHTLSASGCACVPGVPNLGHPWSLASTNTYHTHLQACSDEPASSRRARWAWGQLTWVDSALPRAVALHKSMCCCAPCLLLLLLVCGPSFSSCSS